MEGETLPFSMNSVCYLPSSTKPPIVHSVFPDAKAHQTVRDAQGAGGLGHVAARRLQGVQNHLSLEVVEGGLKVAGRRGARGLSRLERRRQMVAVDDVVV